MGVKTYDHQALTGISDSGTTDGSGTWNVGVNLSAQLSAIPDNAKGALIKTINTSSSARWSGIRINGEATAEFLASMTGNNNRWDFIEFKNGIPTIDFYRQSNSIEFRVLWVLDYTWHFFQRASRPTISSSGGSPASRTIAECPAASTAITTAFRWRPTSESTNITNTPTGQQLIKLDADKTFTSLAGSTQTVIGYTTDADWRPWLADTVSYTADSTWRAASNEYSDRRGAYLCADKTGSNLEFDFRARGSSYASAVGNAADENYFTDLNSLGQFDYLAETGLSVPLYVMATVPDAQELIEQITDIDQSITGQTSTANFNTPFAATSFAITGDTITKTASATTVDADTASFLMPQWVDLETCVALGDVVITATDGTDTTADFSDELSMQYQHPDAGSPVDFDYVELTSVGAAALSVIPLLQIGAQVAFDSTRCDVGLDGRVTFESYSGQSALWYRNPDDKIARLVIIDTSGEPPEPGGGGSLTSIGLTSIGLTSTGPTSVGL